MATLVNFITSLVDTTAAVPEKVVGEDIYTVMTVTLIVWGGVFFYMLYLGQKVKSLKERVENQS